MPRLESRYIADSYLDTLLAKYEEARDCAKAWQNVARKLEDDIIAFSSVDSASDYEGAERLETDEYQIKLTYKLTRAIAKEKADSLLRAAGEAPESFFNVKYDYSALIFRTLDDAGKSLVLDSMTTKRAKTALELIRKEN